MTSGTLPSSGVRALRERASDAVRLSRLTKRFGDVVAVDGLDLSIGSGEVVAVLGPNGAGKTTTLDMLLGLARPDAGEVTLFGGTPQDAVARGRVAAVLQSGGLLKDLTVAETLRYTAALYASSRTIGDVLERAGIQEIAGRRVGACSGGQQQRLRFAMALLPDPDLLVLDEPTTGMDVEGRRDFWRAIRADAGRGRTIMFATHYLDEADAYADRIVLVRAGRVVADGTPAQIKNLAAGRTVRASITEPDATALAVLGGLPGVRTVEVRGDQVVVQASHSDAVARYLLTRTDAHDVEITADNLEQAFLTLTTGSTR